MSNARTLFPGALTPDGFLSCFDQLVPPDRLRRRIILKGGPGVGKSTFMRRMHAALSPQDASVILCFCSGDPDSLDAVIWPEKGLVMLDGTAPHIVDPQIPGARDEIIELGRFLHTDAMRPRLPAIRTCMDDHAALTRRARSCLQAARVMAEDNAALLLRHLDAERFARMQRALLAAVLPAVPPGGSAAIYRVITEAVTPKGEMSLIGDPLPPRVIRLEGHRGMDLTPVLRSIVQTALLHGIPAAEHLNPALPGRLVHVSLPGEGVLITTDSRIPCEQVFDFSLCIPKASLLRHECLLEQGHAAVSLHMHRAVGALAQAKQLHDELETFYVPHMDFAAWQTVFDETLASLREFPA